MPFVNRLLFLLSAGILSVVLQCLMVNADTEMLQMLTLNQMGYNSYDEIVTLENGELVISGNWTVEIGPEKEGLTIIAITEFTIDKYGYHSQSHTEEVPIVGKGVG
ncbi:uncharacterized protein LOC125776841 isoform X10 [Bactrocera dorsalis]|uniref:Uncharacterized protein LOC125776841 isoform X10 n=1 Tax=Bactrocera dorsalis TaxID=27457 RepID=A0ABM3JB11_BACDO|nr:uncharacterized protein LOC125776841 isoform X8 [Bactrocera dorsalis]XP_049306411.1 uncharacterized protein LOC125776841 isoform X8 [Bactrocera dorsalis]XP_049306412.1 uncharacterized protein LOC125776841 isoform X9 [Bactrocera dorsalis]XP_049306413.1 uncharacterized protein LOC125776841 isoform X10 [Bactrocera dorsalis]